MIESTRRIIDAIRAVPAGKVSGYRDVALAAGLFNGARQVVRVLHSMGRSENLPWHRIIKADGRIALPEGGGRELQIALLRAEQSIDAGKRKKQKKRQKKRKNLTKFFYVLKVKYGGGCGKISRHAEFWRLNGHWVQIGGRLRLSGYTILAMVLTKGNS